MTGGVAIANALWLGINLSGYRRFAAALRDPRQAQESILAGYLRRNEDTDFGRAHDFARIRSLRDFQTAVPLSTYDDYQPYIDRITAGDKSCLTREPVKLLAPSSGSTRATKLIPYTTLSQAEFRRGVAPWIVDLMRDWPSLLGGPAYWSITPAMSCSRTKPSAIPIGFDEDSTSLGGFFKSLVDTTLAVPGAVSRIRDIELFRHVSLLFLLRSPALRLISVWHPSFLRFLLAPLQTQWEALVRDIDQGFRLSDPAIEILPDRARAQALARLNPAEPSRIWPNLVLISCWGDGPASAFLGDIRMQFPGTEIQAKGLIATEAFASLPFQGRKPLAVTSHFFEFIDDRGCAHPAWEVESGGVYSLVVTTGSGLYRYRLGDRIEITEFLAGTPCLRFLGKEDHVSDLFGEKLSEGFVAGAVRKVCDRAGIRPRFAMLAPEREGEVHRYRLYLEPVQEPAIDLVTELEAALRENPHYDYCVRIGQLAPVAVSWVGADAYEAYAQRLQRRGQRLGDIKPSPLSMLTGWQGVFGHCQSKSA
jgi:hypothetical protein